MKTIHSLFFFSLFILVHSQPCDLVVNQDDLLNKYDAVAYSCFEFRLVLSPNSNWNAETYAIFGRSEGNATISFSYSTGTAYRPGLKFKLTNFASVQFIGVQLDSALVVNNMDLPTDINIERCEISGQVQTQVGGYSSLLIRDSSFTYNMGANQMLLIQHANDEVWNKVEVTNTSFVGSSLRPILIGISAQYGITFDDCTFNIDSARLIVDSGVSNKITVSDSVIYARGMSTLMGNTDSPCINCNLLWLFHGNRFEMNNNEGIFVFAFNPNPSYIPSVISLLEFVNNIFVGCRNCTFSNVTSQVKSFNANGNKFENSGQENSFLLFASSMDYDQFNFTNNKGVARIDFSGGAPKSRDESFIDNNPDFVCPLSSAVAKVRQSNLNCRTYGSGIFIQFNESVTSDDIRDASLKIIFREYPQYQGFVEWINWVIPSTENKRNKRAPQKWYSSLSPGSSPLDVPWPFVAGFPNFHDSLHQLMNSSTNWSDFGLEALEISSPTIPTDSTSTNETPPTTATSGTDNVDRTDQNNSKGLGVGGIIGIVVGAAVLLVIIIIILILIKKRRGNRRSRDDVQLVEILDKKPAEKKPEMKYLKNIKIGEKIGSGNFGEVYKAMWNGTTLVAAKKINEGGDQFLEEAAILMGLNHPNIVRMIGLWKSEKGDSYMILEYCKLGSLLHFLAGRDSELSDQEMLMMCQEVAAGMMYLESEKIIHRDLAARNLLVKQQEGKYVVVVSDFGLSRLSEDYYKSNSVALPYKWSAPEVIGKNQSSTQSDVWSYGICMWEIYTGGMVPYVGMTNKDVAESTIARGCTLNRPKNCSDQVWNIMSSCWKMNPRERPTFQQIYDMLSKLTGVDTEEHTKIEGSSSQGIYVFSDGTSIPGY